MINLLPEVDLAQELIEAKSTVKKQLGNLLSQWMPARLAEGLLAATGDEVLNLAIVQLRDILTL